MRPTVTHDEGNWEIHLEGKEQAVVVTAAELVQNLCRGGMDPEGVMQYAGERFAEALRADDAQLAGKWNAVVVAAAELL